MQRVIVYLNWKEAWWHERSSLRDHVDTTILSGVSGYAYKQAAICKHMAEKCAVYWLPHLRDKGIKPTWEAEYEHLLHVSVDGVEHEEELEEEKLDGHDEGEEIDHEEEGNEEEVAECGLDDDDDFEFDD